MKFQTIFYSLAVCSLCSIPILVNADGLERATPSEMHRYVRDSTENLKRTALELLSVYEGQRTFANSLQAWCHCAAQLKHDVDAIETCQDQDEAIQATQELFSIWTEILQYPELQSVLKDSAIKILNNDQLNAYQHYIAQRFLENSIPDNIADYFLHLNGNAQEKRGQSSDFKILNYRSEYVANEQVQDLAGKIISANADVVLIQDASFNEGTYSLYEALKNEYCHFYILESPSSILQPLVGASLFVASKYQLEDMQYHQLNTNESFYKEGVLDFVIKNGKNSVGHIYCMDVYDGPLDELRKQKMREVLEMMQKDFLYSIETEYMPYVLCGDFRNLSSEAVIGNFFRKGNDNAENNLALLLRYLPLYPSHEFGQEYAIQSEMLAGLDGILTTVSKSDSFSLEVLLKNDMPYWDNAGMMLTGNVSASGSSSSDNKGNSSKEGGVSFTRENENGTCCSVEVRGRVDRDSDGNETKSFEGKFSLDF